MLQVDARDWRQKIGTQPHNIKGRLIDPHNSLEEKRNFLSGPLVFSGDFDLIWDLRETEDKGLMVINPLRPEIAET